jgi:hypothetical protein
VNGWSDVSDEETTMLKKVDCQQSRTYLIIEGRTEWDVEKWFGVAACVWWYSKSVVERMWVAEKTRTGKGGLVVNGDVYCRGGGCH